MLKKKNENFNSINLDSESNDLLNDFISKTKNLPMYVGLDKSSLANTIITVALSVTDEIYAEFAGFCLSQQTYLMQGSVSVDDGGYTKAKENKMSRDYKAFEELFDFLGVFKREKNEEPFNMRRLDMLDGYVILPDDWIVIDEGDAETHSEAFVIEIMSKEKAMPHLLFFADSTFNPASGKQRKIAFEKAFQYFPELKGLLLKQVEPVYGKEDERGIRLMLNETEWEASPKVGIFKIKDAGTPFATYPYGAYVYRYKDDEDN